MTRIVTMRRRRTQTVVAVMVISTMSTTFFALGGCSLFTDLGGLQGQQPGTSQDGGGDGSTTSSDVGLAPTDDSSSGLDTGAGADVLAPSDPCQSSGLVAMWKMDDGSGTTAKDCSANHLDGTTVLGTPKWNGDRGGAIVLDGATCLDMGKSAPLASITGSLTLTFWMSVIAFPPAGEIRYAIGKRAYSGQDGWRAGVRGSKVSFELGGISDFEILSADQPAQQWIHVTTTFAPNRMALYIGGQLVAARNDVPAQILANDVPFRIGCAATGDRFVNVALDDVRLFSRVLSDAEIASAAK